MQNFNFNLKNSIFTKQAIKAAREKAIKKDVQDLTASSNEVKNLLEQKCDNAGIFRDLTDEEVEARMNAEDQSPLKLIKNLINNKHKDSSGVNYATNQRNDLREKDSSALPQNDGAQSIQGDGEILWHFVPQNDSLPTAGTIEDSETVLIPVENRANATSSLTIKDADGAKPQTLAAGDKLNVTYVYEGETYHYTIEAKSAQNVTLQTKDGYFTVVGDNLAVQTDDEQYSFVALIGTTNSIKIGTNGKTYNANSIAYNSAEGGHSVYTWGDDPTPTIQVNETLSRGQTKTITVTTEEQILELTNPFDDKKYYYKLKVRDDITPASNSVVDFTQQSVKFQFLANGRLVVTGSYVDIEAMDGQKDDLIILGHYNNIKTGDEDDIVRVGFVMDDGGNNYKLTSACTTNLQGASVTTYSKSYGRMLNGVPSAYCPIGNEINTGDGDDHIMQLVASNDTVFKVDMGDGYDSFGNESGLGIVVSTTQAKNIKGAELAPSSIWSTETTDSNGNTLLDGNDGWARQGGSIDTGCCVTLSFINSLFQCGRVELEDIVKITEEDDGSYTVLFKNCTAAVKSVNFTKDKFRSVRGDIDTVILVTAIAELAYANNPTWLTNETMINKINEYDGVVGYLGNVGKTTLSKYLLGNTAFSGDFWFYTLWGEKSERGENYGNKEQFKNLISHYLAENGDLSNLEFKFSDYQTEDRSLGMVGGHIFAIKDFVDKGNDDESYVEVVNPWDDRDCVRLSLNKLYKYGFKCYSFGYTKAQLVEFMNTPFIG